MYSFLVLTGLPLPPPPSNVEQGSGSGDDGCEMKLKPNMHVLGGNPQADIKDEQECVQSCKDAADKCHGIDFQ